MTAGLDSELHRPRPLLYATDDGLQPDAASALRPVSRCNTVYSTNEPAPDPDRRDLVELIQSVAGGPRGGFRYPATHRLANVRSRARGGIIRAVSSEHEEYDDGGRLVSRYTSFDEISPAGVKRTGWRKYDPSGRLLSEGQIIPRGALRRRTSN